MKKSLSILKLFILLLSAVVLAVPASAAAPSVALSQQNLVVNGQPIDCEKYNIGGSNYFKLRDIAYLLNGGGSEFEITWDKATSSVAIETQKHYTPVGGELEIHQDQSRTAVRSKQTILVDNQLHSEYTVYSIGGNNYFKLRDLGKLIGFDVLFDASSNTVEIRDRTYASYFDDTGTPAQVISVGAYGWRAVYDWTSSTKSWAQDQVLVIQNMQANDFYVGQNVPVNPNTYYRLSAMIRMEEYEQEANPAGARLAVAPVDFSYVFAVSPYCMDDAWTECSFVFNSGNATSLKVLLENGGSSALTSGTAYFKDIVLEEMDNQWNVLALIYPSAEIGSYKKQFSEEDLEVIQKVLSEFPKSIEELSGGRMNIQKLDTVIMDAPLRSVSTDWAEPVLGSDIDADAILSQDDYNLVVIYAPVRDADLTDETNPYHGWGGIGGREYLYHGRRINYCIVNYIEYRDLTDPFPYQDKVYDTKNLNWIIHEMLHCIEVNSGYNGFSDFTPLHSAYDCGYTSKYGGMDWYTDLMQNKIPGHEGFSPESFLVTHRHSDD